MKSLIYILITIFIGTTLFSAIPKTALKTPQNIIIQCVDKYPSLENLDKSASIIESRLKDFGLQTLDVSADENGAIIEISFDDPIDMATISPLLTSKGKVEFYETLDRLDVIRNLDKDEELKSILKMGEGDEKFDVNAGILGYCKEENKARVDLYLEKHYVSKPDKGSNFFWSAQADEHGDFQLYLLNKEAALDNSFISEAVTKTSFSGSSPALMLTFDEAETSIWWELTKKNIGKSIAIVLDQKVLSAPMVRAGISGGKCMITGDFTKQEIDQIRALINNEELPLEFKLKN